MSGDMCTAATLEGHGCTGVPAEDGLCPLEDEHHPTAGMEPCCTGAAPCAVTRTDGGSRPAYVQPELLAAGDSLAAAVRLTVRSGALWEQLGAALTTWRLARAAVAPPADLPATLASVDDVRRVCEAAGLEVAHASVAEPRAWSGPNGLYVYACIDETDRPRLAETTVENGSGLVADVHHDAPASVLYSAIQAARSTS